MNSQEPDKVFRAMLSATFAALSTVTHAATQSICAPTDETVFSCQIKRSGKHVALCASKTLKSDPKNAYVIYRFGKPGGIELDYPSSPKGSPKKYRFFHYFRPGLDTTELAFENNGYIYAVFDSTETDLDSGRSESTAGVRVSGPKGKGEITLECIQRTVLASWGAIDGAVPCDTESEANMCNGEQ